MKELLPIILALLSGGTGAAIIKLIDNIYQKKHVVEEKEDEKYKALCACVMFLTLDKIKYLGLKMIKDEKCDYREREILNRAHRDYHKLGGNGDLDNIMKEVNSLPLKV